MSRIKALIFDFDGLMVDTETPIYESWSAVYQQHGHDLPLPTYLQCVGSTISQFNPMAHLDELMGETLDWDKIHPLREQSIREALSTRDTLPGIRECLEEARHQGLKLAIASSSTSNWIEQWLEKLQLQDVFHAVQTRDKVSRAKPAPDLFEAAVKDLGVTPREAVVLEDSYNGLLAAVAAGIDCIIVPNLITESSDFSQAKLVIEGLASVTLTKLLEELE